MTQQSSLETQASGTAAATAFLRALAAHDPRPELRGNDYLAEIFLKEEQKRSLQDPAIRTWVMKNQLSPGAYEFMFVRTAFFDHIVEQALKDHLAQVVFLGAGYDSRPYRFSELIQDTRIFELDSPPTQQRKQECLRQAGIVIPALVRFVPINFEIHSLREVLLAAGFRRESQTLFLWEGVSYYLSREAVDNLLAAVRAISPAGSLISFDYASISIETLGDQNVQEFRKSMRARYANEPARFGILTDQIETFLNERGFQVVEHLTAAEMNARYLPNTADPNRGQFLPLFCFVHARSVETAG